MRFKRVIGRNTLLAMGFGFMSGFGWVVLAGGWVVEAGSLGAIIAFLIGGLAVGSFLLLRKNEPEMPRPFKAGGKPYVGVIALVLGLGIAVQYLPGMPAGLSWPAEWLIVMLWWAAGILFMIRMNAPEYSPELADE